MIWAIAILVFLGTAAGAVFVFILPRIREALRERRKEKRTSATVDVELDGLDKPFTHEIALTENVSGHGARVLTKKRRRPKERVLVGLAQGVERSRAKIAYCDALPGDVFAIGLRFSSRVDWNDQASVHSYRK